MKNTKEKNQDHQNVLRETFEKFWGAYPRKVAKKSAEKIFLNLEPEDQTKAIDGAERLKADPNLPEKQFIPHPATWLNREGWEDEPYPEREKKPEKPVAEVPGIRDWVKKMHDLGEHFNVVRENLGANEKSKKEVFKCVQSVWMMGQVFLSSHKNPKQLTNGSKG